MVLGKKTRQLGRALVLMLILTATTTIAPPRVQAANFDFSISVSPADAAIRPGGATTATVNVTLVSGTAGTVMLSAAKSPNEPSITVSLTPNSGTPSPFFTSRLDISTTPTTPDGLYNITITGTGTVIRSVKFALTVFPAFSVSVSPTSGSAAPGGKAPTIVGVSGTLPEIVNLSCPGLPVGVSCSFNPLSGNASMSFSSTLNVSAAANLSPGTYGIRVRGTSTPSGVVKETTFTLFIPAVFVTPALTNTASVGTQFTININATGFPSFASFDIIIAYTHDSLGGPLDAVRITTPSAGASVWPAGATVFTTAQSIDSRIKYVDTNKNGVWDSGETVVYDIKGTGAFDSSDPVIAGVAPAVGTMLNDNAKITYVDSNNNNIWNPETLVYDTNNDGVYGALAKVDPKVKYFDANSNNVWDFSETVAYDSNANTFYDAGEPVMNPKADVRIMYNDTNNNNHWDAGEPVVYDTNSNGVYDTGETVIAGVAPAVGTTLKLDPKVKYVDVNANNIWGCMTFSGVVCASGEAVVYDANGDRLYETGEPVILAPAAMTPLKVDPKLKFVDANTNNIWDAGEAVVYDTNGNGLYDTGEPIIVGTVVTEPVIAGTAPAAGTVLKTDPKTKYVDTNGNNVWDAGEVVIYDSNGNGLYDTGETVIAGVAPAVGTMLKSDTKIKYFDLDNNNIWNPEPVVFDSNGNGVFDVGEPVMAGPTPVAGTVLKNDVPVGEVRFAQASSLATQPGARGILFSITFNVTREGSTMLTFKKDLVNQGVTIISHISIGGSFCFLRGDVNKDGAVNFLDLGLIGSAFLKSSGQTGFNPAADVNKDGVINFLDLGIVGSEFLRTC